MPLACQWRRNGALLAGRTDPLLTLNLVQPEDFGSYTVGITNADGFILSQQAMLTRAVSPIITPGGLNYSTFTLAIPTEVGPVYEVEYKDQLTDPAWRRLTTFGGTGYSVQITDNGLTNATRFYRVRVR